MRTCLHNNTGIELKDASVKQLEESKAWWIATIEKWKQREETEHSILLIFRYEVQLNAVKAELATRIGKK